MIRRHKLKNRISKKRIKPFMDSRVDDVDVEGWIQIDCDEVSLELSHEIYESVGVTADTHYIIIHLFKETIEGHIDNMDKCCLLVPLKVTSKMVLYEEHQTVSLKVGEYYSFNDFNYHGLYNKNHGYGMVATVSKKFEQVSRLYL